MNNFKSTEQGYNKLEAEIFQILAEKGPADTTMDLLARRLSMSKRTLYEIFGSKDEMIRTIMQHIHQEYAAHVDEISRSSRNMMETMANLLLYHQKMIDRLSKEFFVDMDTKYRHLRPDYNSGSQKWSEYFKDAIITGIKQGVFREDANYDIIIPLFRVQMESLKRMEELFPPGITLAEAYNAISLGFLRSIANQKGLEILETVASKFDSEQRTANSE